ncbi:GGDEF domain-containing protein [Chromatiaceae bacterium AAb-1]|nr:GGDEF domain-containing protein [Chromatiaceae bacterium AAb-1]
MKYQDSLEQASEKATQVSAFLFRHKLAPHPVNYTVSYEYISGNNAGLVDAIEQKLAANTAFDDFIMSELYSRWLLPDNQQQEQLLKEVSGMVSRLSGFTDVASEAVTDYLQQLELQRQQLQHSQDSKTLILINSLQSFTTDYQLSLQQLQHQLELANQQSHQLRGELEETRQKQLQDPQTGLYNRIAMQNQVDIWLADYPDRTIAAIAIDLNNFSQFSRDYGHLVGDVILSRVARKISSYVQESGMPVRSGVEQFLLLLPDVDLRAASEIAEQVRKGVEKLRFISSRNKKALPKVTLSLGVTLYQATESWYQFLARTSEVLKAAQLQYTASSGEEMTL